MPFWLSIATVVRGWRSRSWAVDPGIPEMQTGIAAFAATGTLILRPFQLGLLAEELGRAGQAGRGLSLLADALTLVDGRNERWFEAELRRRQGDLLRRAARGPGDALILAYGWCSRSPERRPRKPAIPSVGEAGRPRLGCAARHNAWTCNGALPGVQPHLADDLLLRRR